MTRDGPHIDLGERADAQSNLAAQADRFLLHAGLLSQQPILLSQVDQFFFCRHALSGAVLATLPV